MAAMLSRSNNRLLSRFQTLSNLHLQFQVQKLKRTFSGPDMHPEFSPEVAHEVQADMSKWKKMDARGLGISRMMIPHPPWAVLNRLHAEGFQVYLVGGCVRDLILKKVPKDFDVITTASLIQVKNKFHRCQIVGRRFPVCLVQIKGSIVEVSSFQTVAHHEKKKAEVCLSQMPSGCREVDFILQKDSMRRDFTVNSLFYDPFVNKIYDYANGIADLRALKLRTLIPAQVSFKEDCARILRGLRIAARLGLSFSTDIETAIHSLSSSIQTLDKSRLMLELNYMLSYGASEHSLHLLQKVNLLEFLFPFHAAYLDHQTTKKYAQKSTMLMKLFSNLDRLVSCDQPSNPSVWVGLLAFHHALVNNPQDALVVRAFASVLYHGRWKEGAKFVKEHAQVHVNFVPEISGPIDFISDEKLANGVTKLASLVQRSIPEVAKVFISKRTMFNVRKIFEVLADDVKLYDKGRERFDINYHALGKGSLGETRFVLGKVILGTMNDGAVQTRREIVGEEENHLQMHEMENGQKSDVYEKNCNLALSGLTKEEAVVSNSKKRRLSQPNPLEKMDGKRISTSNQSVVGEQSESNTSETNKYTGQVKKRLKMVNGKHHNVQNEPKGQQRAMKLELFGKKRSTPKEHIGEEKQGMFEIKECSENVKKDLQVVNGNHSKPVVEVSGKQPKEKKCNAPKNEIIKEEEKKNGGEKIKKQNRSLTEKKGSQPSLYSIFK